MRTITQIIYHGPAFITPGFEDYATWRLHGGVYGESGNLLSGALRDTDTFAHNPPQLLPPDFEAEVVIPRGVFLGHWFWHFGHFLLETVPMLDAGLNVANGEDPHFLFFANGFHLLSRREVYEVEDTILKALGIPRNRINIIKHDTCVLDLIVPAKPYKINHSYQHEAVSPFRKIAAGVNYDCSVPATQLYLSRRKIAVDPSRFCVDEYRLEAFYSQLGYSVISPEQLPFETQVALASRAPNIVGLDGSALYLMGLSKSVDVTCFALREIISLAHFANACEVRYTQILLKEDAHAPGLYRINFEELQRAGFGPEMQASWNATYAPPVEAYEMQMWRASRLLADGKHQDAVDVLKDLGPDNVEVRGLLLLASALEKTGDLARADAIVAAFWRFDKNTPAVKQLYFRMLLRTRKFDELVAILRAAGTKIDALWLDAANDLRIAGGPDVLSECELVNCVETLPLSLRAYRLLADRFEKEGKPKLADSARRLGRMRLGVFWSEV